MKATVGIDPGHGGNSSGTYTINTVKDGLFERDFTLEQALLIEKHLLRNGFKTVLTRRTDRNPGNVDQRAKVLVSAGVDFAVSVHFNGFSSESANGTEVFVPHAEKFAGIESGFYETLGKIFRIRMPFARSNSYFDRNRTFDKRLNRETRRFDAVSAEKDYFGFIRTCWENGVSADLIEICFLTNSDDFEKYLKNREQIAEGIARNIVEGFGEKYIPESLPEKTENEIAKPKITATGRFGKNRLEMIK